MTTFPRRTTLADSPDGNNPLRSPHADDVLLTLSEVANIVRVPVATLRYWRHLGTGPRSFRIGRSVRYWRTEVVEWLEIQADATQSVGHDPGTAGVDSTRR